MIGIILMAHGRIAEEVLNSVQNIVGKQDKVWAINILPQEGIGSVKRRLQEIVGGENLPGGYIIVVDMFGGTPYNACSDVIRSDMVSIISGMNLPIVIALLNHRKNLLRTELVKKAISNGRDSVVDVRGRLKD